MNKQEVPITSRVAQAIQSELERFPVDVPGLTLDVFTEEFTPIEESRVGADLYISVVRTDQGAPVSKGMLVQSKQLDALKRKDERRRLRN